MAGPLNRVLGSDYRISFSFDDSAAFMEVDKFTFKASDEKKEFMPAGYTMPRYQLVHNGFDLTFEGGIVNDDLQKIFQAIYDHNLNSKNSIVASGPRGGNTTCNVTWALSLPNTEDGALKIVFNEVTFSEMNLDYGGQAEEIKQSFNGKAKYATVIARPSSVVGAQAVITSILGSSKKTTNRAKGQLNGWS